MDLMILDWIVRRRNVVKMRWRFLCSVDQRGDLVAGLKPSSRQFSLGLFEYQMGEHGSFDVDELRWTRI